jgi:hypothetical protein
LFPLSGFVLHLVLFSLTPLAQKVKPLVYFAFIFTGEMAIYLSEISVRMDLKKVCK